MFQHCISSLKKNTEVLEAIKIAHEKKTVFILGICVGMQILASIGEEFGNHEGLNFISGNVKKNFRRKYKTSSCWLEFY